MFDIELAKFCHYYCGDESGAGASAAAADTAADAASLGQASCSYEPAAPHTGKEIESEKENAKICECSFNKVETNIVKASSGANPSGAPGSSQNAGPNSSSGLASPSANSRSADGLLFGQSEKTNGAYKAVFATRQSLRVNPIMDAPGGGVPRKNLNWVLCQQRGQPCHELSF